MTVVSATRFACPAMDGGHLRPVRVADASHPIVGVGVGGRSSRRWACSIVRSPTGRDCQGRSQLRQRIAQSVRLAPADDHSRARAGPVVTTPNGDLPIVYPSPVFVLWAVLTVLILMRCDENGFFLHERIVRIDRVRAGIGRDIARVVAMAFTLNITFWFVLVLPTILIRQYAGGPSIPVP
jgi:hypothetical protein